MPFKNQNQEFNVWPILIDMITSVLIIFILYSFLDQILNQRNLNLLLIDKKRQAFVNAFNSEFDKETKDSTILLKPELNYLQITFSDQVLFNSGEYEINQIKSTGIDILSRTAKIFKQSLNLDISQIQVEGHTDIDPIVSQSAKIKNNWDLSAARAITIVRYLTERKGIDSKQILFSANGFSQFDPVAEGVLPEAKKKNRRIELKVYFKGLEKS